LVDRVLKTWCLHAEETGVIAGMQHHNDFLYEADEVIDILKRVNSDWFGLILDIGSLRRGDPYKEIQKLAPYAINYTGYISFESLTDATNTCQRQVK